jgi:hypothetical protein
MSLLLLFNRRVEVITKIITGWDDGGSRKEDYRSRAQIEDEELLQLMAVIAPIILE